MNTQEPKAQVLVNTKKQETKAVFKIIPLDNINERASKAKKIYDKVPSKSKVSKKIEQSQFRDYNNNVNIEVVDINFQFETQAGSIREFLNQCHPEVRLFIKTNEIAKVVAEAGRLVVTTKNKFRVEIIVTGKYTNTVIIKDKRSKVLFNGKSSVTFQPVKKAS